MSRLICIVVLFFSANICLSQEITFTPDDSQTTIQTAINKGMYKKVVFSPGVYTKISSLTMTPKQVSSVTAHGAKFLLPPNQARFNRYFNIVWYEADESPSFIFDGGEFDMNEPNQGRVSYNKEHHAAIFVDATRAKINVIFQNITIRQSAGDGISFYRNVMGKLSNLKINECFRGGLTVSGSGNEVIGDNLDLRGVRFRTGMRIEPSSYNSRHTPAVYIFSGVRMNWFNFQLGNKSSIELGNSVIEPIRPATANDGRQGYVYNEGGKVHIHDTLIYSNRQIDFRLTGDSKVSNCTFYLTKFDETDTQEWQFPLNLQWYYRPAGDYNDNQQFIAEHCDFQVDPAIDLSFTKAYPVRTFETHPYGTEHNFVLLDDIRVEDNAWRALVGYKGRYNSTKVVTKGLTIDGKIIPDRP